MLRVEALTVVRAGRPVLENLSLTVQPGRTLAVIGESGAGKSTLIAAILGLLPIASGRLIWADGPVRAASPALVMQEPRAAFNPALTLRRSVLEPLAARRRPVDRERLARLLDGLEITADLLDRRPREVSIGQAQRLGILRALIAAPQLVLFDEPLSALDTVTQKYTASLISRLQAEEGFAALIVTHDLGYAAAHADDVAILRAGRITEAAPTDRFFRAPETEYGSALCAAAFALGALEAAE